MCMFAFHTSSVEYKDLVCGKEEAGIICWSRGGCEQLQCTLPIQTGLSFVGREERILTSKLAPAL